MNGLRFGSTMLLWASAVALGCSGGHDDSVDAAIGGPTVCGVNATTGDDSLDACIDRGCCEAFQWCQRDEECLACIGAPGAGCEETPSYRALQSCLVAEGCVEEAGAGGAVGHGGAGGKGGAAGAGGCSSADDCASMVPMTQPPGCAEGVCDQGVCKVVARDKDHDGKKNKFCKDPEGNVSVETGNDCDDSDPNIHPGAWDGPEGEGHPESCDGVDQDCSGTADDATLGDKTSCVCTPGAEAECSETSNGKPIDFPTGKPLGQCKTGTKKCVADLNSGGGKWGLCTGAVGPELETCDGEDDDCDGQTDEQDALDKKTWMCDADGDGHLGPAPATADSCGVPGTGCTGSWTLSGPKDDCDDSATGADVSPGNPELCDGKDNDCNGSVDENPADVGAACSTGKPGACAAGIAQCASPQLVCNQLVDPTSEVCNGSDDDCNGQVDEGNPGGGMQCEVTNPPGLSGPCRIGITTCEAGSVHCNQSVFAVNETCNGTDDDCDGQVDEGYVETSCNSGLPGVCSAGKLKCQGGYELCVPNISPNTIKEACNNSIDEDCNGLKDDGCPCATVRFFDSASSGACSAGGTGSSASSSARNTCLNVPDPVHDGAAQLTISPNTNCVPGDGIWLYDYDGCSPSGEGGKFIGFTCTGQSVNLNCLNFADKAGSFKIVCNR